MRILIVNRHREDVVGGSEIQCDQIARELARRGHEVAYAVMEPRRERYAAPYPCLVVESSRTAFEEALARWRPEVVYWRFNRRGLRAALGAARRAGAVFLNALACRRVDGFVVQHRGQARGLPEERTRVIHNSAYATAGAFRWPRPYVAWVANVKSRKRPERFVELARALADEPFDCLAVGALQDRRYAWLADRSRVPARFHYLGALPPEEVNALIAGARCVVLTCEPEGFPNVLLQAWQLGVPTASLAYDPDGLIAAHELGAVAGTVPELAAAVRRLASDEPARTALAARARALVEAQFSLAANVRALEAFAAERLAARRGA